MPRGGITEIKYDLLIDVPDVDKFIALYFHLVTWCCFLDKKELKYDSEGDKVRQLSL